MVEKDDKFNKLMESASAKFVADDFKRAIAYCTKAIRLNPEDEIPRENRSEAKEKLGNDD